jgi:DNA-binding HxlR family transcriptional regulator
MGQVKVWFPTCNGNSHHATIFGHTLICIDQLREMEEDQLITRTVIPGTQSKVVYSITDLGRSLMPILNQMYQWGEERISTLQVDPQFSINDQVTRDSGK